MPVKDILTAFNNMGIAIFCFWTLKVQLVLPPWIPLLLTWLVLRLTPSVLRLLQELECRLRLQT